MVVDVLASVFRPLSPGDAYFVVASASPANQTEHMPRVLGMSTTAASLAEASKKSRELALALKDSLEKRGYRVREVNIEHSSTQWTREIGAAAD